MDIGGFHPIFVHFPVVLLTAAVMLDAVYYHFFDKKPSFYAHWIYFAAFASLIPSIMTGWIAAESHTDDVYLSLHRLMAFFLLVLVLVQVIIRAFLLFNKQLLPSGQIVFFSLVIFILVSLTGDVGGILTKGSSPFVGSLDHHDFDYNSADSREVRQYNPEQLAKYLEKKIDVLDVIPIFKEYRCASCHASYFKSDIPYFSDKIGDEEIWLPRDESGQLVEWDKSPFYKTTVLLNRMPIDENKDSKGIAWSERLILIRWLENNAPTTLPEQE